MTNLRGRSVVKELFLLNNKEGKLSLESNGTYLVQFNASSKVYRYQGTFLNVIKKLNLLPHNVSYNAVKEQITDSKLYYMDYFKSLNLESLNNSKVPYKSDRKESAKKVKLTKETITINGTNYIIKAKFSTFFITEDGTTINFKYKQIIKGGKVTDTITSIVK